MKQLTRFWAFLVKLVTGKDATKKEGTTEITGHEPIVGGDKHYEAIIDGEPIDCYAINTASEAEALSVLKYWEKYIDGQTVELREVKLKTNLSENIKACLFTKKSIGEYLA